MTKAAMEKWIGSKLMPFTRCQGDKTSWQHVPASTSSAAPQAGEDALSTAGVGGRPRWVCPGHRADERDLQGCSLLGRLTREAQTSAADSRESNF